MPKQIPLTQGKFALVDDDMYDYLMQWRWAYSHYGYAVRTVKASGKTTVIWMHREVAKTPDGMVTDHINQVRTDNRAENLRVCTVSQNAMNKDKSKPGTSKYKGVYWFKPAQKWVSRVQINNQVAQFTYHDTEAEAAIVYNFYARQHFGEFAVLNEVPDEDFPMAEREAFLQAFDDRRKRRLIRKNTSGVAGVRWHKGAEKWSVTDRFHGTEIYVGVFREFEDAVYVRDQVALQLHGVKAKLNLLTGPYIPLDTSPSTSV